MLCKVDTGDRQMFPNQPDTGDSQMYRNAKKSESLISYAVENAG